MKIEDLTKIHKVLGAGLVDPEGTLIESRITFDYDAEKLGAMAARVVNRSKKSLGLDRVSVILYAKNIVLFTRETDKGIFFVVCQKDANLGLIKVKIEKLT
jgi:predicted regulator of Ras-like GTPase activity (Roadblock/LC7/MglB family)